MRFQSKSRAAEQRKHSPAREAYLQQYLTCMVCRQSPSSQVHEICRGPSRRAAFGEPACWLATCTECNTHALDDYSVWPLARQLACKLVNDSENFNLDTVNRVRGRGPCAIKIADLADYLAQT